MPYLRVWLHIVWGTKNRYPYLTESIRPKVFTHFKEYADQKGINLLEVNGHVDHVHCLVSLNSDQNIATIVNLLKGESSFWINRQRLTKAKFGWADDYFAASVSHSALDVVRAYIQNQENHHSKKSFREEYDLMMEKYGVERN